MTREEIALRLDELQEELNDKQQAFCRNYVVNYNGTQAATKAGYSANTARSLASQLLTKLNIKEFVNLLKLQQRDRLEVSADKVVKEFAKIAFQDPRDIFEEQADGSLKMKSFEDMEYPEVISEVVIEELKDREGELYGYLKKIKTSDKLAALNGLAKHYALYTTNVDITSGGKPIESVPQKIVKVVINHRAAGDALNPKIEIASEDLTGADAQEVSDELDEDLNDLL